MTYQDWIAECHSMTDAELTMIRIRHAQAELNEIMSGYTAALDEDDVNDAEMFLQQSIVVLNKLNKLKAKYRKQRG